MKILFLSFVLIFSTYLALPWIFTGDDLIGTVVDEDTWGLTNDDLIWGSTQTRLIDTFEAGGLIVTPDSWWTL